MLSLDGCTSINTIPIAGKHPRSAIAPLPLTGTDYLSLPRTDNNQATPFPIPQSQLSAVGPALDQHCRIPAGLHNCSVRPISDYPPTPLDAHHSPYGVQSPITVTLITRDHRIRDRQRCIAERGSGKGTTRDYCVDTHSRRRSRRAVRPSKPPARALAPSTPIWFSLRPRRPRQGRSINVVVQCSSCAPYTHPRPSRAKRILTLGRCRIHPSTCEKACP